MVDTSFLLINPAIHTFLNLHNSPSCASHRSQLVNLAHETLQLMNNHQALAPSYQILINYLNSQRIAHPYTERWVTNISTISETLLQTFEGEIKSLLAKDYRSQTSIPTHELFTKVSKVVESSLIQGKYYMAQYFLDSYGTLVQFISQPATHEILVENSYLQYLFYQYIIGIYRAIWFPVEEIKSLQSFTFSKEPESINAFKLVENSFKKIVVYYSKNETLLKKDCDESRYYWLARYVRLALLFMQLRFEEFKHEFIAIKNEFEDYDMEDFLSGLTLKSAILIMYGITLLLSKPFKELSLIDDDVIIDLFIAKDDSLQSMFYYGVLLPLSKPNFKLVQTNLNKSDLTELLQAHLGFTLPLPLKNSVNQNFLEYVLLIIQFKSFISIMSVTKQIPAEKLFSLMGFDDLVSSEEIIQKLMTLIGGLGLGKMGVGYNADEKVFYNDEVNREKLTEMLQGDIERLARDMEGESMATLMKGLLIEKYFN